MVSSKFQFLRIVLATVNLSSKAFGCWGQGRPIRIKTQHECSKRYNTFFFIKYDNANTTVSEPLFTDILLLQFGSVCSSSCR